MEKFAVIQTGGKQYQVKEGDQIKVEKIEAESGNKVTFDKVLLSFDEEEGIKIGTPLLEGFKVQGEVSAQGRGKKIVVFKYKPKKHERKKKGHRQRYTLVKITRIEKGESVKRKEQSAKQQLKV